MREYVDPPDEGLIAQPFLKTDLPCIRNYSGSIKQIITSHTLRHKPRAASDRDFYTFKNSSTAISEYVYTQSQFNDRCEHMDILTT
jgi:hypothetical protein